MKTFRYIIILAAGIFLNACQKMEYDKEFSSTYPISGDWTLKVSNNNDSYGPFFMKIYNTSFSKDSVWVDDNGLFWPFKAKARVNMKALTFEAAKSANETVEDSVTFRNGKLIGNDSIYFEVEFTDDPGTIYKFSGHRKVSYDEYNSH